MVIRMKYFVLTSARMAVSTVRVEEWNYKALEFGGEEGGGKSNVHIFGSGLGRFDKQ